MDVLIADFDFFSTAGGGQTYYRKLVERNPSICFYFFTRTLESSESTNDLILPGNAFPIPYQSDKRLPYLLTLVPKQFPSISPEILYWLMDEAMNMAYSVAGRTFDIVDVPSFRPIISFLAAMFKFNEVKCDRYVLSIHGWSHKAMDLAWERSETLVQSLLEVDKGCLEAADIRYEISKFSLQNTRNLTSLPLLYYDIHNVLDSIKIARESKATSQSIPDIWYPARLDRQKGIDIFLRIVAKLPKHLYGSIRICGPDGKEGASTWLDKAKSLAKSLGINFYYHGSLKREQVLEQIFSQPNYCIFPSRYDSFGLAITEALFSGCPIAISDQCGASLFLQEEYPELPISIFEPDNLDIAISKISEDLARYHELRDNLQQSLLRNPLKSWSQDAIVTIYCSPLVRNSKQIFFVEKLLFSLIEDARNPAKLDISEKVVSQIRHTPYMMSIWQAVKSVIPIYLHKPLRWVAEFIKSIIP